MPVYVLICPKLLWGQLIQKKYLATSLRLLIEQTHGLRKMSLHLSSRSLKASSVSCLFTLTLLGMRERRVKLFGNNEKETS